MTFFRYSPEPIFGSTVLHFFAQPDKLVDFSYQHTPALNGTPTETTGNERSVAYNGFTDIDFISVANSSDFNFGTDDFTIEAIVQFASGATDQTILSMWDFTGLTNLGMWLGYTNNTDIEFKYSVSGTDEFSISGTVSASDWHLITVVRRGSNFSLYFDGTEVASTTDASAIFASTRDLRIGTDHATGVAFSGDIQEVRLISGEAIHTPGSTFTKAPIRPVSLSLPGSGGGGGAALFSADFYYSPQVVVFQVSPVTAVDTITNIGTLAPLGDLNRNNLTFDGFDQITDGGTGQIVLNRPVTGSSISGYNMSDASIWTGGGDGCGIISINSTTTNNRNIVSNSANNRALQLRYDINIAPAVTNAGTFNITNAGLVNGSWLVLAYRQVGGVITLYLNGTNIGNYGGPTRTVQDMVVFAANGTTSATVFLNNTRVGDIAFWNSDIGESTLLANSALVQTKFGV